MLRMKSLTNYFIVSGLILLCWNQFSTGRLLEEGGRRGGEEEEGGGVARRKRKQFTGTRGVSVAEV